VATVRDDDDGGDDGRDADESVSRGGTPAPLPGSGATPGGGAAGSEAGEGGESGEAGGRAGTSGTGDEETGDDDGGDSRTARRPTGGRTGFGRRWRAAKSR
jgi:hypothetical protein